MLHPFRSLLYVPASNSRAMEKARGLSCDAIILDLEDAVSGPEKSAARNACRQALANRIYGNRPVIIRVNGFDALGASDDLAEDLAAVLGEGPHAILFPKIRFARDAERAQLALSASLAPVAVRLWLMIETPQAVLDSAAIAALAAQEGARLEAFVVGTNDLAKELHLRATPTRLALLHALSTTVLAARAYGLQVFDGVYGDIHTPSGFESEAMQGKGLGFDGKTLIHPSQIDGANRIFSPSPSEVAEACAIVEAFEAPANAGRAVLVVDGRMVERLHYDIALRTLRAR
ncbi:CitE Citrate lyase beta subunit [Rhabdaerophilaceae bacterium]